MSLDGFLTFLSLVIAVYAIQPVKSRLVLRLRVLSLFVSGLLGFLAVMYFQFSIRCNWIVPNFLETGAQQ